MKPKSQLIILLAVLLRLADATPALSRDFLAGFETGIFVRDDDKAFDDYSCSKPD